MPQFDFHSFFVQIFWVSFAFIIFFIHTHHKVLLKIAKDTLMIALLELLLRSLTSKSNSKYSKLYRSVLRYFIKSLSSKDQNPFNKDR